MTLSTGNAGLITGLAGTISSASAAYNKSYGQRSALEYQASVADFNSKVAGWQASDAIRNGQTAEGNQDLKVGAIIGTQRAQLAANGVDLGSGSTNDVLTTSKFMGARDALQIHDNAMMAAWGYRTQQQRYVNQAGMLNSMSDGISPGLSGVSSLLTGAANVGSNWDKQAKVNGTDDLYTTVSKKWDSFWKE